MGHVVTYIIDVSPAVALGELDLVSGSVDSVADVRIPGEATLLYGYFDGLLTLLFAPVKYSLVTSGHEPTLEVVARLDACLRDRFAGARIVRFDELLFDDYMNLHGEDWHRSESLCREFFRWLGSQDQESWREV